MRTQLTKRQSRTTVSESSVHFQKIEPADSRAEELKADMLTANSVPLIK
jgi:hypothetical protein